MKKGKLTAAVSGVALLAGTIGLTAVGGASAQASPQLITDTTLLQCVDASISANIGIATVFGQYFGISLPFWQVPYPEQPGSSGHLMAALTIPALNSPMLLNLTTVFSGSFWSNLGISQQTVNGTSPAGNAQILFPGFWSALTPYCNNTPGTGIQNLNGLGDAGFTNLLAVNFDNNNISDISGLSNVTWNNWIINSFPLIGNWLGLTPKAGDGSLLGIFLDGNPRLSDLSPLVTQKNTIALSVNGDAVYDLSTIGGAWFNLLGSWGVPIPRLINAQGQLIPWNSTNAAMNSVSGQETPILPILPNGFPVTGPQLTVTPTGTSGPNVGLIPGTNVPTTIAQAQNTATSGTVNPDGTITFATPGWYTVKWNAPSDVWGNLPFLNMNSTFSGTYYVNVTAPVATAAPTVTVTASAPTCSNGQNIVTNTNLRLREGESMPNQSSDGSVQAGVANGQLVLSDGGKQVALGLTGSYYWAFQADGNVVQYSTTSGKAVWASNTRVGDLAGNYVAVQCNGDLVVYPGNNSNGTGLVLLSLNH